MAEVSNVQFKRASKAQVETDVKFGLARHRQGTLHRLQRPAAQLCEQEDERRILPGWTADDLESVRQSRGENRKWRLRSQVDDLAVVKKLRVSRAAWTLTHDNRLNSEVTTSEHP